MTRAWTLSRRQRRARQIAARPDDGLVACTRLSDNATILRPPDEVKQSSIEALNHPLLKNYSWKYDPSYWWHKRYHEPDPEAKPQRNRKLK